MAAIIKADLAGDGGQHGEYTEAGYRDQRFQDREMPEAFQEENFSGEEKEENNWDGTRYRGFSERSGRGYDGPYRRAGYGGSVLHISSPTEKPSGC